MKTLIDWLWLALATCYGASACSAETWELQTRPGVTQRVLVEAPDQARAAAILFAGGDGGVVFVNNAAASYRANFLLRSSAEFLRNGFVVAIFGAPSDKPGPNYLDDNFRKSKEHAEDTLIVVNALRKRFGVPVWLVGTSRGTISAAAAGLHLGKSIDGVVLTATMADVIDLPIDRFEVPVLMAHHEWDRCRETYFREARRTAGKVKAPRTEFLPFSGGKDEGPACQAMAYHGFNGIEPEVVAAIAKWMLKP
jgi:pimeloyl-ACP methyl ester carboxylesterase